ncbi:response regulator [uncultured Erythrobacter sp.]|uniref:response regulator n=1 Tax=uncultured Erythrobacter sp. TaxID=263913 RepID=UPI002623DD66|nr:response regulator [uncultured Erythrobacter sp.]
MHEPSPKILIIDDDDISAEMVARALRKDLPDLQVLAAEDGMAGLEVLRGRGPQPCTKPLMIFLDLNMPRMNGFEFLEEMREDPELRRNVVFIFSTSEAEEDLSRAYDFGVAGYITKSRVGRHMCNVTDLLKSYASTVILPA